MGLQRYKSKRDFSRSGEPVGRRHQKRTRKEPFFVVQKHAATRLHYDFRLEIGGVLKSWAVPKGFPVKRGDRRLAVQVEDHPVEYADFEGTIPAGNYGAGTVMVWDMGAFRLLGGTPEEALRQGKLHLLLRGTKLKGEWTLVRMKTREGDDPGKPQWLLLKSDSDRPPFTTEAENQSLVTKRTMEEIASDNDRQWQSNREVKTASPPRRRPPLPKAESRLDPSVVAEVQDSPAGAIEFRAPMKAAPSTKLPKGDQWIYEIKFDGVRALALRDGKSVRLISRNEKELAVKYPELIPAFSRLKFDRFIIDGEIVAVDKHGIPSFQLLQSYHQSKERPPLLFYAFDLLNLAGRNLEELPLHERRTALEILVKEGEPPLLFSGSIPAGSDRALREMQARGLEGLIAKQKNSRYESGRRSGAWVKYKWSRVQEFVIGGYTPPQGTRPFFGAILIGFYENGQFRFAGKVGTGFDYASLHTLHSRFQKLRTESPAFSDLKPRRTTGGGLTPAQLRTSTWVRPEIVCQVRFMEWTRDGQLRHPAFLGLREDKDPAEVVREPAV